MAVWKRRYGNGCYGNGWYGNGGMEMAMLPNKIANGSLKFVEDLTFTSHCIIAEIHRLSFLVPTDFANVSSSAFNKLLINFSYFENRATFDKFTEGSEEGRQLEREFYARFSSFLEMFGHLIDKFYDFLLAVSDFSSIFPTYKDQFSRLKCVEQLELFGGRLLHLLGIILLLIDQKFPSDLRERIFVAFYRLRIDFPPKKLETVVNIFRNRREPYESSFLTIGINEYFVQQMITFLQFYKGPRHGWLENALYVCLYFEPGHDTLNNQFTTMRQIIDHFFANRWILHLHVDFQVNLFQKWGRFKAANAAIASTWDASRANTFAEMHFSTIRSATFPTSGLLSLEMFDDYDKMLRAMNGAIKWLILHLPKDEFMSRNKRFNLFAIAEDSGEILTFLKQLSQFEYKFRKAITHLRNNRQDCINALHVRISDNFSQIIAFLRNSLSVKSGRRTGRVISWLESVNCSVVGLASSLCSSDGDCTAAASVSLDQLRARISEVCQSQCDSTDQQQLLLRQCLLLALADLRRLRNVCAADDTFVDTLSEHCESVFLFRYVGRHCAQMEQLLHDEALSVKFIFLKVAESVPSIVFGTSDLYGEKRNKLCSFYYSLLEIKLRAVIQAVPRAVFHEMAKLNDCFPTDTSSVSIEKARIREFSDFKRRRALADLTFKISKLALGISNTCIKQLGDVEIQPRALLADGLRRELDIRLKQIFASDVQPNILRTLQNQSLKLQQFRKSFLFICDHVGIRDGIRIWTEQLKSILEESLNEKIFKTAERTTMTTSVAPFIPQSKLVVEKLFDFTLSATAPQLTKYNRMESIWRSVDGKTIKFYGNVFASLDNWLLYGLNSMVATLLAKDMFELQRIVTRRPFERHRSLSASPTAFIAQLTTNAAEFTLSGPNRELLVALAKLGQQLLLLRNLQMFVKAEKHSQLGTLQTAERTLRRLTNGENISTDENNPTMDLMVLNTDNASSLLDFVSKHQSLKSPTAQMFFLSVILYFSFVAKDLTTTTGSQKGEKIDGVAVMEGAKLMLQHSPLWTHLSSDATHLFVNAIPSIFCNSLSDM
ncbi:hypothetical protein niasHS_000268 [Heterodera schachtii]|uniref:WASH complex subunit 7 n=1 Tax=Heterodera schachtii TaxID=97005 RepID=A0ABD2KLJ0_HETSC